MAVVFQLGDGNAGSSDFSDTTKNNIVSAAGEASPPKHIGAGGYEGKSSQAFVGSEFDSLQNKKVVSFLEAKTAAQSNTEAGTQTGTPSSIYTKDGVDFTLTAQKYYHPGWADPLTAEKANSNIALSPGPDWQIADWNDFASFTEDDFKGFLRILTPLLGLRQHAQLGDEVNCSTLLERVNLGGSTSLYGNEWFGQNFGWVLFNGDGSSLANKYMGGEDIAGQAIVRKNYMWTFWNNGAAIPLADHPQQYLNRFVILSRGERSSLSYICKRTGSSLPNTKGGCF